MKTRAIAILVMVPVIWACTYFGGLPFLLLILAFALTSVNEFYNMMMKKGYFPAFWVGNAITIFFIWFAYLAAKRNWEPELSAILTLAAILALISGIFLKREKDTMVDVAVTVLGMIYIGWFFSYFFHIRNLSQHGGYLFFMMLTIWGNDVVAYLVGSRFGRTKLAPSISPKKSVEGAAAGFATCLLAAACFSWFLSYRFQVNIEMHHALILGSIIGIVAVLSDLIESVIKRDAGVKDSSRLVPGHGGVLDRMDSFILTAPVVYYYLVWVVLK
ncbi:phosphatidate cytidylyltransferase [Candidatus Margulisiibacteriota bacterium]